MSNFKALYKKYPQLRRSLKANADRPDELQARLMLKAKVALCAEDGKVALVNWGMDCDCSRWDDRVSLVPANVMSVLKWEKDFYEWAEGPQGYRVTRPSMAPKKSSSRDLAMEAFEDGHAHVVYV